MLIGAVLGYSAVLEIATSHGLYAMLLAMTVVVGSRQHLTNSATN